MINRTSFLGYADVDRYNLYGGLEPAFAHVFFELLPHWLTAADDYESDPRCPDL